MSTIKWTPKAPIGSTHVVGPSSVPKKSSATPGGFAFDPQSQGPISKGHVSPALTTQLEAMAYATESAEVRAILRAAAEAVRTDPSILLRSSGPGNLPQKISGTIHREIHDNQPVVRFTPDDRTVQSFRLSPADLQGVPEKGRVTLEKVGLGKGQKLQVDAKTADRVRSFVGKVELRGKQLVAVALDPLAPIRDLPLPGAKPELAGKTILAHVAEPLADKRFGIVEDVLPDSTGWRSTFLDLAVRHGVEATFSPDEKADVARIKKLFDADGIPGYEDMTKKPFFAVDNPYSKDFDQAMHLEPSKQHPGATDVYYAIADVGYFLKMLGPESALAQRAARMQTTTYMPGLDAPVLDRSLSEDLISLGAGVKRPAFVIKYTVAATGDTLGDPSFHDAVIQNRSNTNYPAVQRYFEGKESPATSEIKSGLDRLQTVGTALLQAAKERGMVTSSEGETWATIDKSTGKLEPEKRGMLWVEEANAQISITANHLIGKFLIEHGAPAFHRVHPEPDPIRLAAAKKAVEALGVTWPEGKSPADVLQNLDKSSPNYRAVRRLLLRAQPRAVISAEPSPHSGLKLAEYVQSTAPMRRERDCRNHDFVRQVRDGKPPDTSEMATIVAHANAAQDKASLLNRAVRDWLTAQSLAPFVGKPVEASIIGVSPHGIDVYLPGADAEVFIPMRRMGGDLKLDKGGLGLRAGDGTTLALGDPIEVVVRAADPKKGTTDVVPRKIDAPHVLAGAPKKASAGTISLDDVRGDGFTSKYVGQTVATKGVVTALNGIGFYIAPLDGSGGGTLVRARGASVAPGDVVEVRGMVREVRGKDAIYDRTVVEISNQPKIDIVASGHELPPAFDMAKNPPPADKAGATEYWRKLLGQRVTVGSGTAISPSNRFNDLVILPDSWNVDPKLRAKNGGVLLGDDDNFTKVGLKGRENIGGLPSVSVGDKVEGVEGVVTYRSGDFQLELGSAPKITAVPKPQMQPTTLIGNDQQMTFSVVNALNMHLGEATRAKRLAERIVNDMSSPDIVALQEIQDNDGPVQSHVTDASQIYQMLIDEIVKAGGPEFKWVDVPPENGKDGGQPGGNIRTGYLYQADRVTLDEASVKRIGVGSDAFEGCRKSLAVRFKFKDHDVAFVNNHLSSRKGSTPWNAEADAIVGGAERRLAQATEISKSIGEMRKADPKCDVIVVGDFNDFPTSKPVSQIASGGMTNLSMLVPAQDRYDYNYRGTLQALTSVIGNQALVDEKRIELEYLHHNSIHPIDDSDHDHVVGRISIKPATS